MRPEDQYLTEAVRRRLEEMRRETADERFYDGASSETSSLTFRSETVAGGSRAGSDAGRSRGSWSDNSSQQSFSTPRTGSTSVADGASMLGSVVGSSSSRSGSFASMQSVRLRADQQWRDNEERKRAFLREAQAIMDTTGGSDMGSSANDQLPLQRRGRYDEDSLSDLPPPGGGRLALQDYDAMSAHSGSTTSSRASSSRRQRVHASSRHSPMFRDGGGGGSARKKGALALAPSMGSFREEESESSASEAPRRRDKREKGHHSSNRRDDFEGTLLEDLEAKLKVYQRRVDEAVEAHRVEAQRAAEAEKKLKKSVGGSDLEMHLMRNLVQLREKCSEIENTKEAELAKVQDVEDQLNDERSRREETQKQLDQLQWQRNDELERERKHFKERAQELERAVDERNEEGRKLKQGMEMISQERDETLELLERAVKQKEQLKRGRRREVEEAHEEMETLKVRQDREQKEVRRLLSSVDHLLAKFGRSSSSLEPEALHELVAVRDSMRQLVRTRNAAAEGGSDPLGTGTLHGGKSSRKMGRSGSRLQLPDSIQE
eukprot:CAMPEP_0178453110 /NCGR_PEP_ID=MMETSP0689_2-20121128/44622_1 /TAXON_ID=160604 /ORGANISM="Amphidinium massartii, Strain CS-259" /LENGTH=547 /DNA_ID=CAMNT_0020078899 /DNA_START=174 /DNA_END=1818 /DNA_ORIENTATION=+